MRAYETFSADQELGYRKGMNSLYRSIAALLKTTPAIQTFECARNALRKLLAVAVDARIVVDFAETICQRRCAKLTISIGWAVQWALSVSEIWLVALAGARWADADFRAISLNLQDIEVTRLANAITLSPSLCGRG